MRVLLLQPSVSALQVAAAWLWVGGGARVAVVASVVGVLGFSLALVLVGGPTQLCAADGLAYLLRWAVVGVGGEVAEGELSN